MEDFANRQVRIFGHSVPLVFILLIIFVGVAIAGIFALMSVGLEGNIKEVPAPTMTGVSTNDDAVIDFAQFDGNDTGLDPNDITVPGGASREIFDMQLCTASINGGGNVDVIMQDTYYTAYCSLRISVVNETPDPLYLIDAIFNGTASLDAALNPASSCGYVLQPTEIGNIILDVWPLDGATGSWSSVDNEIQIRWGLQNTFVCP